MAIQRIFNCPCDATRAAKDEQELIELARRHLSVRHPGSSFTEEEIKQLVKRMSKDA